MFEEKPITVKTSVNTRAPIDARCKPILVKTLVETERTEGENRGADDE